MNEYLVEIELDTVELRVKAKNETEARKKATSTLKWKKNDGFNLR